MDDVEDNSELRRGEPVAHTIYGVPQTINTANYVYFQAIQELLKLQHTSSGDRGKGKGKEDLIGLVTEELLNLHRGQGLDLFWRDSLVCPTEEEYVHMVLGSESSLQRSHTHSPTYTHQACISVGTESSSRRCYAGTSLDGICGSR
jgi:geranylgeranyl diphosphate synthase type 3